MSGLHADLSSLTGEDAQRLGDMNGDFENNYFDFVLFKNAYDAANGAGAFASAVQAPEPTGAAAMAAGGVGVLFARRFWGPSVNFSPHTPNIY
jgi:hypothetical protein